MSERDDYAPGVPCWVDTWQADAAATAAFYAELMGWETERTTPDDAEAQYVMCRLRGRDVAAIGSGVAGAGASGVGGAGGRGVGSGVAGAGASGVGGAGASASAAGPGASPAGTAHTPAAWTTYVQVASVQDTVAKGSRGGRRDRRSAVRQPRRRAHRDPRRPGRRELRRLGAGRASRLTGRQRARRLDDERPALR